MIHSTNGNARFKEKLLQKHSNKMLKQNTTDLALYVQK